MGSNMKTRNVEARTAVIGIGGAGCNVINEFYWNLPEVDTIAIDSDLSGIQSDRKFSLQSLKTDSGDGFRENDIRREVAELLRGYDIVYVIAGLGGHIGSPISPLVADVAANSGCMVTTIAINPSASETGSFSSIQDDIGMLRSVCPMTLVVENGLVPDSIDDGMRFDVVNRSIVSYVAKHREKLISTFLKNLNRNVKEALREDARYAPSMFAKFVTN